MKKLILAIIIAFCAFMPQTIDATAPAPGNTTDKATVEIVEVNINETTSTAAPKKENVVKAGAEKTKLTPAERNKRIKEADSNGIGITIMSMAIVICSLIILSLLFLAFGKISQSMHTKKKLKDYGLAHDEDNHEAYSGEACAAIAAALFQYFNDRHDVEDTVLTMRKLKRAYSPWSSKLYNLRQVPERNNWHR